MQRTRAALVAPVRSKRGLRRVRSVVVGRRERRHVALLSESQRPAAVDRLQAGGKAGRGRAESLLRLRRRLRTEALWRRRRRRRRTEDLFQRRRRTEALLRRRRRRRRRDQVWTGREFHRPGRKAGRRVNYRAREAVRRLLGHKWVLDTRAHTRLPLIIRSCTVNT